MTLPLSLLAIDLGAESGRAIVGSLDHERLTLSEVHRFPNVPVRLAEALYWDVLRIWDEIQSAIVLASRKCNREIASIGVDTWGVDFGLLDAHGTLIANPVRLSR